MDEWREASTTSPFRRARSYAPQPNPHQPHTYQCDPCRARRPREPAQRRHKQGSVAAKRGEAARSFALVPFASRAPRHVTHLGVDLDPVPRKDAPTERHREAPGGARARRARREQPQRVARAQPRHLAAAARAARLHDHAPDPGRPAARMHTKRNQEVYVRAQEAGRARREISESAEVKRLAARRFISRAARASASSRARVCRPIARAALSAGGTTPCEPLSAGGGGRESAAQEPLSVGLCPRVGLFPSRGARDAPCAAARRARRRGGLRVEQRGGLRRCGGRHAVARGGAPRSAGCQWVVRQPLPPGRRELVEHPTWAVMTLEEPGTPLKGFLVSMR